MSAKEYIMSDTTAARILTLGHSPDSDDAFMFYALAKGKIDSEGLTFEHVLRDIQTLNDWAREAKLDTTAISVHAYAHVQDKYALLAHGASMGDGYGPMIVTREAPTPSPSLKGGEQSAVESVVGKRIAIPGPLTSAYLAFQIYMDGRPFEAVFVPFDQIIDAVKDRRVDAGLIIHEGQLTHGADGLHSVPTRSVAISEGICRDRCPA
jgi:1,4-dihydroxy-6-naphthoate synthase